MKFFLPAVIGALSFVSTQAMQHQSDIYYHEKPVLGASMWHFSTEGLTIYSPSGQVLKQHTKNMLCPEYTSWRDDSIINDCSYYAWASDGHRYVWAGSMAGDHHVQAFDIDTGDYAGYIDTCSTPLDMEYHPARQEMYLRCAQATPEDGDPSGEIDVFSSATLSADIPMISFNATMRPYGRFAIHSAMGPYGYSLAYDQNFITELDLSAKTVSNTYEIPDAYGGYDTTYSPINQHLYFRARVCCTCGTANNTNPDVESCGRGPGGPVMVKTGPSKDMDAEQPFGTCGAGCEGSVADTIGVVEFDTVNKKFVDTHNIKEGTGFGADPVSSPDGKWIVLLPNDGGKYVRILQPGLNGGSSANGVRDVMVDFTGGTPGKTVISDFAFVQDENRDILVLGASTDNNIVLVDLRSDSMTTRKLDLAPGVAESTGGSSRNLEWAVGTNYVWVDGAESEEQYIINISSDINSAKVARTMGGIASGNMMSVNNYERMRDVAHATAAAAQNTLTVTASSDNDNQVSSVSAASSANNNEMSSSLSSDNESNNNLGVAGIVLGSIGFVAGLGALVLVLNKERTSSVAVPASKPDVEEAMSLGSKRVN